MTITGKDEETALRNRLNPIVKDEFVTASSTDYKALHQKERLDRIKHLEEMAKLEQIYIDDYE